LNPSVNKHPWTAEEDEKLTMFVSQHGNKWSVFSKVFQGRTPTAIKNRWNVYLSKNIRSQHRSEAHE
jgi:myb proto-oncogene protein